MMTLQQLSTTMMSWETVGQIFGRMISGESTSETEDHTSLIDPSLR